MTIEETSTPATETQNPLYTMEIAGSTLTYQRHAHEDVYLKWAGPLRGTDNLLVITYRTAGGVIGWDASVYAPAWRGPIAKASTIDGPAEAALDLLHERVRYDAVRSLCFLSDIQEEVDPLSILDAAVKAFREYGAEAE